MGKQSSIGITELHLHLEGSLAVASAIELARSSGHAWGALTPAQLLRSFRYENLEEFLATIREMCRVLNTPEGLNRTAYELSHALARDGVLLAEVYCSPYIFMRWGQEYDQVLDSIESGFARAESEGGAECLILIDTVRQWGPAAATILLDNLERSRSRRVVGFGMGGDEKSIPLEEFAPIYERARSLGLRTTVHAGEAGTWGEVEKAVDILEVDRIAHGISAVESLSLMHKIRDRGITLDLALTSNYKTGVVRGAHPIRTLIDTGVRVTLSSDDPSLFNTSLVHEYKRAKRCGGLRDEELWTIARNGIEASFTGENTKVRLREELERRARLALKLRFLDFQP